MQVPHFWHFFCCCRCWTVQILCLILIIPLVFCVSRRMGFGQFEVQLQYLIALVPTLLAFRMLLPKMNCKNTVFGLNYSTWILCFSPNIIWPMWGASTIFYCTCTSLLAFRMLLLKMNCANTRLGFNYFTWILCFSPNRILPLWGASTIFDCICTSFLSSFDCSLKMNRPWGISKIN